jgi:acyl carrier protein
MSTTSQLTEMEQKIIAAIETVSGITGKEILKKITRDSKPVDDVEDFTSLTAVSVITALEEEISKVYPNIDLTKIGVLFVEVNGNQAITVKDVAQKVEDYISKKGMRS